MSCSFQGSLLHNLFLSPHLEKKIDKFRAWFTDILRHHRGVLRVEILFACTWRGAVPLETTAENCQREANAVSSTSLLDLCTETELVLENSNPSLLCCLTPPFCFALLLSHWWRKIILFSSISSWANTPWHVAGLGLQLAFVRGLKLWHPARHSSHQPPGAPGEEVLLT